MEEHFDNIGKREGYNIPGDFFENITEKTLFEAKRRANKKAIYLRLSMSLAASIAIGFTLVFSLSSNNIKVDDCTTMEEFLAQISDSEIATLATAFEDDDFYE